MSTATRKLMILAAACRRRNTLDAAVDAVLRGRMVQTIRAYQRAIESALSKLGLRRTLGNLALAMGHPPLLISSTVRAGIQSMFGSIPFATDFCNHTTPS